MTEATERSSGREPANIHKAKKLLLSLGRLLKRYPQLTQLTSAAAALVTVISAIYGFIHNGDLLSFLVLTIAALLLLVSFLVAYGVLADNQLLEAELADARKTVHSAQQQATTDLALASAQSKNRIEELAVAHKRDLEQLRLADELRSRETTDQFIELTEAGMRYEDAILDFLFIDEKSNKRPDFLRKAYTSYLTTICETAVNAISLREPGVKCSSNIKLFSVREMDDATEALCYKVLARAKPKDFLDKERAQNDKAMAVRPYPVSEHKYYHEIFNLQLPDYYLLDDLEKLLAGGIEDIFTQPLIAAMRYYKSALIVPILGDHIYSSRTRRIERYRGKYKLGIMCIDSPEKGFFNAANDLAVMRQLSKHAFSAIRDYDAIWNFLKMSELSPVEIAHWTEPN